MFARPVVLVICAVLCFQASPAHALERIALVIGNSSYVKSPLENPQNDAQDVASRLESYGFKVKTLIDEDQRQMEREIRRFTRQLNDNTVGLFYFAGHGVQVRGQNYLIPIDAQIEAEEDVRYEAVPLGRVIDGMRNGGGRLNLVILDACRNNPYSRSFRSANRGLARSSPATGTMIMYATEPGNVASDGAERNGIFTGALLEAMDEDDSVGIETLFKRTSVKVNKKTNGTQAPWSEGIIYGDFRFSKVSRNQTATEQPQPIESPSPDTTFVPGPLAELPASSLDGLMWQSAERIGDLEAYRAYAEAFPDGIFVRLAQLAIVRLEAEERAQEAERLRVAEEARLKQEEQARLLEEQRLQEESERVAQEKRRAEQLAAAEKAEADRAAANLRAEQERLAIQASRDAEKKRLAENQARIQDWINQEKAMDLKVSDRLRVQIALNAQGINVGAADGRWGPRTRAGIETWQESKGSERTGYLDEPSYKLLIAELPSNYRELELKSFEPEMVSVPAGSFTMGDRNGPSNERPARNVRVERFEVSRYEVTFAQFDAFTLETKRVRIDDRGWGRGNRPVINVTWEEAKQYVAWLSKRTGKSYRLLSEAEWEYAARAGTTTTYSFSNSSDRLCSYANGSGSSCDRFKYTAPVGTYQPNRFGLFDMHGNVNEWVEDCWHSSYKGAPSTAEPWIESGRCNTRVSRGGAWSNSAKGLRTTTRSGHTVKSRLASGGFRVARSL